MLNHNQVWSTASLGEIALIKSGGTPNRKSKEFWEGGDIPWVTTTEVNYKVITDTAEKITQAGLKGSSAQIFEKGTLLIALYGQGKTRGQVGVLGIDAATNQACAAIIPDEWLTTEFLFYFLEFSYANIRNLSNSGGQDNLSAALVKEIRVPTPEVAEQCKITEILRTWDEAIEKLEALRAAKEGRFQVVAQKLLAPSRAIGRHIPRSNWALTTFGEVFEERKDRNDSLGPDDVVTVGKYAIRKQSEHFSRSVASKDLSNYWVISPGDFVYDPMSAYYGALGRYEALGDGIVSPAYRVIRLNDDVLPDFMAHILRSHHIRFLLETRSSQGNKEGKRRLLQRGEFAGIEFNLPPMEGQKQIAATLADFRSDVAVTERQLETITRQKRGLMQKLLTGEWRVIG